MKSTAWYFYEPGNTGAIGPFRFEKPITKIEAKNYIRNWLGVKKLPNGYAIWPVTPNYR